MRERRKGSGISVPLSMELCNTSLGDKNEAEIHRNQIINNDNFYIQKGDYTPMFFPEFIISGYHSMGSMQ